MRHAARLRLFPVLFACLLAAPLALGGCSFFEAPRQTRGNLIEIDRLKELQPGVTTKADVASLFGTPTAKASFDDNTWLYIGAVTRPRVARTLGLERQQVIALSFNEAGVLTGIRQRTEDDSLPVAVVARTTPAPGSDASILQQLLGGVGRYNPVAGGSPGGSENINTH